MAQSASTLPRSTRFPSAVTSSKLLLPSSSLGSPPRLVAGSLSLSFNKRPLSLVALSFRYVQGLLPPCTDLLDLAFVFRSQDVWILYTLVVSCCWTYHDRELSNVLNVADVSGLVGRGLPIVRATCNHHWCNHHPLVQCQRLAIE